MSGDRGCVDPTRTHTHTQRDIILRGRVYLKNPLHVRMIINEIFLLLNRARLHSRSQQGTGTVWSAAFLSLSHSSCAHALTFHPPPLRPPSPIETGYQSYLLNLMHALSTHSHPVTSPLNIETGFSGITRTFLRQNNPPKPPPHPYTPITTPSFLTSTNRRAPKLGAPLEPRNHAP